MRSSAPIVRPSPPVSEKPGLASVGFWACIVALAAVAVHLPALGHPFLYDSGAQILLDGFLRDPRHLFDVLSLRVLGMDVLDFNRPCNLLSLMVDCFLWGENPAGFRLTGLLLHGATVALLFRLVFRLLGEGKGAKPLYPAMFASLFFALHPLHAETIVEVGYREDLLATFFLVAALTAAHRFPGAGNGMRRWPPGLLVVVCAFLGLASKESGIAIPLSVGVFWLLYRRGESRARWGLLAVMGAVCGTFLAARFALEPQQSVIFTERPARIAPGWVDLFLVQTRIWAAEFLRIVWPAGLCADYTPYLIRNVGLPVALAGVAATLTFQIFGGWKNRAIALGAAVFWLSLLPVSNFIPIYRPMADRFLYMPMIGVALILAAALEGIGVFRARIPALATAVAVVSALAWRTMEEEAFWRDGETLWAETVRRNPTSPGAWINLGGELLKYGDDSRLQEAGNAFARAVNLTKGKSASAFAGLSLAATRAGDFAKAAQFHRSAVALDARYAEPHKFEQALIYTPAEILQLTAVALRSSHHL